MIRYTLRMWEPGSDDKWSLEALDEDNGSRPLWVSGSREVVLAAFAEHVEELHAVTNYLERGRWAL